MRPNETSNSSYRLFGSYLLVMISIGLIVWLVWLMVPSISGRNLGYSTIGSEPFPRDVDEITLLFYLHDFESGRRLGSSMGTNAELIEVKLPIAPKNILSSSPCVNTIEIDENFTRTESPYELDPFFGSGGSSGSFGPSYEFLDFCTSTDRNEFMFLWNRDEVPGLAFKRSESLGITSISDYYFPFDQRVIDFDVWVNTLQETDQGALTQIVAPNIEGFVNYPEWEEKVTIEKKFSEERGHDVTNVHIMLRRQLAYRAMAIILLGGIGFFSLAIISIENVSSLLEVAIGILLGLWGIKIILVPENVTWPTIIDPLVLTLYGLFAIALFIRFIVRPLWKRLHKKVERIEDCVVETVPLVRLENPIPLDIKLDLPEEIPQIQEHSDNEIFFRRFSLLLIGLIALLLGLLHIRGNQR